MKRELTTTPLKRIRPVFVNVGENVKRYDQMRGLFTPDAARIFAEPLVSGPARDQITWYSDYTGPFRTLASLSTEEQTQTLPLLNEQVNYLFRDLIRFVRKGGGQYDRIQYAALRRSVESALQVPSNDDILLFETPSGTRFLLINWGFTLDLDNAERDLIRRLVPFGVTPVGLAAIYHPSGEVAANEPLTIRWENHKTAVTTDAEGRVLLPQVPYLSELTVSQTDAEGNEANRQTVLIDERDPAQPYSVVLQRLAYPMTFKVINQRGSSVSNHPVRLDYRGLSVLATSDTNGKVFRTDMYYGDSVLCFDQKDPKVPLVQTHTFRREQAEYPIPVVIPDPLAPVKTGFKYIGCLGLLLLLLLGGLITYYYFGKKEQVVMSREAIRSAIPSQRFVPVPNQPDSLQADSTQLADTTQVANAQVEAFKPEKASCNDERNGMDNQYATARQLKQITTEYDMAAEGGTFQLDFYTDLAPDQIEVFDGPVADLQPDSQPLFSYFGSTISDYFAFGPVSRSIAYKSRYVTVRVTGQSIWNYKVNCPR